MTDTQHVKYSNIDPGIKLAWTDEGNGAKTILFIHGMGGFMDLWKWQVEGLKTEYRCVAVDLPGNGLSQSGNYPYNMFFYAETLARFVETENLQHVTLCGHSMGGQIAIILALRYPQIADRLMLIAPAGLEKYNSSEAFFLQQMMGVGHWFYMNAMNIDGIINQSFFKDNDQAKGIILRIKQIMKNQPAGHWNNMITESVNAMLREQVYDFLPQLQLPVDIIFGSHDAFIPNRAVHPADTLHGLLAAAEMRIANCTTHVIKGAGHFVHIEKMEEVNRLIKNALK